MFHTVGVGAHVSTVRGELHWITLTEDVQRGLGCQGTAECGVGRTANMEYGLERRKEKENIRSVFSIFLPAGHCGPPVRPPDQGRDGGE